MSRVRKHKIYKHKHPDNSKHIAFTYFTFAISEIEPTTISTTAIAVTTVPTRHPLQLWYWATNVPFPLTAFLCSRSGNRNVSRNKSERNSRNKVRKSCEEKLFEITLHGDSGTRYEFRICCYLINDNIIYFFIST